MKYFRDIEVGDVFIDSHDLKLMKTETSFLTKHSKESDAVNCVLLETNGDFKKGTPMYATPDEGVTLC